MTRIILPFIILPLLAACNGKADIPAVQRTTDSLVIKTTVLAEGLNHPWAIAFLPDGQALITERAGTLRILAKDGTLSEPVQGAPEVVARGQGGMLDVAVDPDFGTNNTIYLSFAEKGNGGTTTALGKGTLNGNILENFSVIFRQLPYIDDSKHFGNRIVIDGDYLFLGLGERFQFDPSQDLGTHLGKVIRIHKDGSVPEDNPFVNQSGVKPEIWSYGHRNIQSAAQDPATGALWVVEMGPQGGDELNRVEKGANYGWPLVSWGNHYDGEDIPDHDTRPEFKDAALWWTPVIAPSGMLFYTGAMFPALKGEALIGGLMARGIVRVRINGETAVETGRIDLGARTRDLTQAPDGSIYAITDESNGKVIRMHN